MPPGARWTPLLSGSLQAEALAAIDAILHDVRALSPEPLPAGLLEGHAGYALFFGALGQARGEASLLEQVGPRLERATEDYGRARAQRPGLHTGVSGLAWAASHLGRHHPELDGEDLCATADALLEEALSASPCLLPCDVRDGLAGIGLYALERWPAPSARRLLALVVDRLEDTSETLGDGRVTWRAPRAFWSLHGRDATFPRGLFTVGVAHGVPPALAVLAAAHRLGLERERTGRMLEGGLRWLASRIPGDEAARFPHYLHGEEPFHDERQSWCVGPPGITAVAWWAARVWGHAHWEARTLAWTEHAARACLECARPLSANLCCGTAGTAHLFLRLFQETRRPLFEEAAVHWLRHTLSLRQPGRGPGGYCFEQDVQRPVANVQFGAAGIALALHAATSSHVPEWDRPFLFSLSAGPRQQEP